MPLNYKPYWIPAGKDRLGYSLSEQQKYKSNPLQNSTFYLVIQVIIGLAYMYFTINQKLPISVSERVFMSATIFLMIGSWAAILQGRWYAQFLEVFRLILMALSFIWIMQVHGYFHWTSWESSLILFLTGGSILWVCFYFKLPSKFED